MQTINNFGSLIGGAVSAVPGASNASSIAFGIKTGGRSIAIKLQQQSTKLANKMPNPLTAMQTTEFKKTAKSVFKRTAKIAPPVVATALLTFYGGAIPGAVVGVGGYLAHRFMNNNLQLNVQLEARHGFTPADPMTSKAEISSSANTVTTAPIVPAPVNATVTTPPAVPAITFPVDGTVRLPVVDGSVTLPSVPAVILPVVDGFVTFSVVGSSVTLPVVEGSVTLTVVEGSVILPIGNGSKTSEHHADEGDFEPEGMEITSAKPTHTYALRSMDKK